MLNNIGCICKVLLSLNLESCCAPESGVQSLEKQGLLAEIKRVSGERRSIKSAGGASCAGDLCCSLPNDKKEFSVAVELSSKEDIRASKTCGTDVPTPQLFAQAKTENNEKTDCGPTLPDVSGLDIRLTSENLSTCTASCCSKSAEQATKQVSGCSDGKLSYSVTNQVSAKEWAEEFCTEFTAKSSIVPSADDCAKGCCSEKVPKPITVLEAVDYVKGCSSKPVINPSIIPACLDDCSKGCCSGEIEDEIGVEVDPAGECVKGCCSEPKLFAVPKVRNTLDSCCSSSNNQTSGNSTSESKAGFQGKSISANIKSDRNNTKCGGRNLLKEIEILPHKYAMGSNALDLEKGACDVEHLIISVQGMTCTGCEKSLAKALKLIPTVSNIKTSLVLGRAEFDIRALSFDATVIETIKTLEKMTGFTCSKMTLSGHELDLIVRAPSVFMASKDSPFGISDITELDSRTIRVIYSPEDMGARDLIGHPFFESAKLAPIAAPPLISSGRAHLRSMLFKTLVSTVLTIPVLILSWADLPPQEIAYGATSLVLATIVQVWIAGPWYLSAYKALFFSHMVEVDFLVVLSTSTAYIYSIIAYAFLASHKPLSTGSFFEASTLLVTLIMVGRLVTSLARQRAVESISIESLQPSTAILVHPKSDIREEIDARLLQYGDAFVVLPVCIQLYRMENVSKLAYRIHPLSLMGPLFLESQMLTSL